MATDIERLIVSLEASTAKYERALIKANGETDKRVRAMQSRFDGLGSSVSRMERGLVGSFGAVGRAFGVLGIALTTTSIIAMTSAWTDLNSRVNNAAGGIERGAAVMDQLSVMARRTYSNLNQTAEGYLQNSQALTALGYSTQQQLDLVEALNNSLVISATRGQAAESVMSAWSKAMAEGKLSGDNLNTIIQSGGRLSKALADSMGVSVNELRKLGSEGKITTDVMYGVTSQLQQLRDEAERMPATVSDGFTLLQNAVFKFVGQADEAVGSSNALAEAIIAVADAVDRAPDEPWFDRIFGELGDEMALSLNKTYEELVLIGRALDYISNTTPGDALADLASLGEGESTKGIEDFELALGDAEQAVANLATNTVGRFGEIDAAVQDLFQQVLEGRGSAEKAEEAIIALGQVNPEFAALQDGILSVITNLYAMRDAAVAANQAAANTTTDLGSFPSRRVFNREFGPDLSTDGAPGGPIRPPSSGSGGGSKKSPTEKFGEDLTQYARKIEMLKQETALTASLNPLLNGYGFAKERLQAVQELENAAVKAGIALGPEQRAQIDSLADGYAGAVAEAAKLAEAQGQIKQAADDMAQAARGALDSIVDGFLEGRDAGEIFNSVLKDLGKNFLKLGLNSLFGGGGGLGGLFGGLFGGKGFATGTANTGGVRGQPRGVVHGQEAVIPLPSGGRVPVEVRMPSIPRAAAPGGAGQIEVKAAIEVVNGNLVPVVTQISGQVAGQQIKANTRQLPNMMQDIQMRQG